MQIFVMLVVMAVTLFMVGLSFRAIYIAFLKKKDERSKLIVTKSMAGSFLVIVALDTVLLVIKWFIYDSYNAWWESFKNGIYIEPVMLNFIIFGIVLMINTKRHGGSL